LSPQGLILPFALFYSCRRLVELCCFCCFDGFVET